MFYNLQTVAIVGAAIAISLVVAAEPEIQPSIATSAISGAYIVEFADAVDSEKFIAQLAGEEGVERVSSRLDFKSSVFRGISFNIQASNGTAQETEAKIAALTQVKQLWPIELIRLQDANVTWTGKGRSLPERRRQANQYTPYPPHVMTQVDRLHTEGFTGKGLRIGVLDSGIDYTHPALGGCFGPGCLVTHGADLVGDSFDGSSAPVTDNDPFDACHGHGTHVAGIIAAKASELVPGGAAPDVKLGAYRVISCAGYSSTDIMIAGVIKAYEDGSDIITGSVGEASGWGEHPFAVAVSRIVAAGVPCTFAAGNEAGANYGLFSPAAPSSGKRVMAISSFDDADNVSSFTSWGPTFDMDMKPQFGAPGRDILSTYPVALGSYAIASGTSMATPLVASIVALISQVRGTRDPKELERVLSTTARPANRTSSNGNSAPGPVVQQGAGMVQAYDAAHASTTFNVPNLSFNDTSHFESEQTFKITNRGGKTVTYTFSHKAALSATTLVIGIYRNSKPELFDQHATLTFDPPTIKLEAGAQATVRVFAQQPSGLDAAVLPVYSGWVVIDGKSSDVSSTFSLPYIGAATTMRSHTVMAAQRMWLTRTDDQLSPTVPANATFQIPVPALHPEWAVPSSPESGLLLAPYALPDQLIWLVMGSAEVHLELLPISVNASLATPKDNGHGAKTLGNVAGYPQTYRKPIGWLNAFNGLLADGQWAPPGRYRLTAFALKLFGIRGRADSYDRYDSTEFEIRYVD
ncbi:subtilase [Rhexocercosporidium sp. MPI-PUGE-AT-0058]|nr:subtilase [Rhexocercosporidium sp. MPI-PUGE-AT-0058]